jgi:hypothetical protein
MDQGSRDAAGVREAAVRGLLDSLLAMLRVAGALVASGRAIELTGIDAVTGRICASVLDLGPERSRGFRGDLARLDAEFERLIVATTRQMPEMAKNMDM